MYFSILGTACSFIYFSIPPPMPFSIFCQWPFLSPTQHLMAWRGLLHMTESFRFKISPSFIRGESEQPLCTGVNECEGRFFFVCVLHIMFLTPRGATINCRASFTRSDNSSKMRIWRQITFQFTLGQAAGANEKRCSNFKFLLDQAIRTLMFTAINCKVKWRSTVEN